ncbi:hypothetical protein [Corynebacterium rouxii]|uniref:hypothetical protein n=1 Tax=Corynebacterium rouxii TaxID=2719119 RepID=UPI00313F3703
MPRLRPREFFGLVVEVPLFAQALSKADPFIPNIRRRNGLEAVTYEHLILERSVRKTLGVPLFQEQLMHIAVDAAGFSGGEADELRRAMGSRRSVDTMNRMKRRFFAGLRRNNITDDIADILWNKIVGFGRLWFSRIAFTILRGTRVLLRMVQISSLCRVLRRVAAHTTDGLLLAAIVTFRCA